MVTRLSRKAQERAALIAANFDQNIRKRASERALLYGQEFATEADVTAAMQDYMIEFSRSLMKDRTTV